MNDNQQSTKKQLHGLTPQMSRILMHQWHKKYPLKMAYIAGEKAP
jgi:hypothetical protein